MKNIYRLILSAHIAAFGIQWAADPAEAQVLGPGDDAIITPDGRTIINPPLPNPQQSPPPIQNADGSTTYPVGTTPPPTDGFTQVNRDGSVTIFPRGGTDTGPQLRPGDSAIITPDGRLIINPPEPSPGPQLRPGDSAIVTPDGRLIVNPPEPGPPPIQNPDGSTTYPVGTTPPPTDGFTQVNRDGSVTIFPRESAPSGNQPDAPAGFDFRLPWRVSDGLQLRARYEYFRESETPELQENAPMRDQADDPIGLDLRFQYPFSDRFEFRLPYEYQPESGAEDDSPIEPPTIEFLDDAESPAIDPEGGDGEKFTLYPYRGRFDAGGSVYIDPPTLILDDDVDPPVESVIPELQGGSPSTSGSETGDQADAPVGSDFRVQYPFSDSFQLRARYDYQPESGAEDDSPIDPPTIELLDEAESPPTGSVIPELGGGDGDVFLRYYYLDRTGGGMTRVDPPTLTFDDEVDSPVESVIPELQGGSPSTSGSETDDRADAPEGLDFSIPDRFSDSFDLLSRY